MLAQQQYPARRRRRRYHRHGTCAPVVAFSSSSGLHNTCTTGRVTTCYGVCSDGRATTCSMASAVAQPQSTPQPQSTQRQRWTHTGKPVCDCLWRLNRHPGIAMLIFVLAVAVSASAAVPPDQTVALNELYSSTDGKGWKNSSNWGVGDPCANAWFGVSCSNGVMYVACSTATALLAP